jgi:hypothetical protein
MSKKKARTWCFVIDASIARAASSLESRHPTGRNCRDFLIAVRGICHRMAWSEGIKAEWDKHESAFAFQWRLSMMKLNKLRPVKDEMLEDLREAIAAHSEDRNVVEIMVKDAHLIEAAFTTDSRVAALDETVRSHFSRLAATFELLRGVLWVNPATEGEAAIDWLKAGAPAQRARCLKP